MIDFDKDTRTKRNKAFSASRGGGSFSKGLDHEIGRVNNR